MNDFTMAQRPDGMRPAPTVLPYPHGCATPRAGRWRRAAMAVLMLAAVAIGDRALAQPNFERGFGRDFNESGAAVQQTADGGFVTAGYTADPRTGAQQVYVIRTDAMGSPQWQRRIDIGGPGNSYAIDVHQTANGDHIVVGTADDPTCAACSHIFAFLISDAGVLIWERLYQGIGSIQVATGVVETQVAIGGMGNYVGQFVISGYAQDVGGERYAFLMRLTQGGDPMWSMIYDAQPGIFNENEFNSVDETQIGAGPGDIVAVGRASTPGSMDELFVMRVDPLRGTITNPPQSAALYGTPRNDRGYSIIELRHSPTFSGDLVITGESDGRPGVPGLEILMLELRQNVCDPLGQRADLFQGDGGREDDYGRCVREITDAHLGAIGDVIVTGTAVARRTANDIFGKLSAAAAVPGTPTPDIFLEQYRAGGMVPASPFHTYGGLRDDHGRGVGMALAINFPTLGFIITGESESPPLVPPANRWDLPLVRTDNGMFSCSDLVIQERQEPARLTRTCISPWTMDARETVQCRVAYFNRSWQHDVCAQP